MAAAAAGEAAGWGAAFPMAAPYRTLAASALALGWPVGAAFGIAAVKATTRAKAKAQRPQRC